MRLQHYLKEEYFADVKSGVTYPIFKNPTGDDFAELLEDKAPGFRFIADMKNKNVYITDNRVWHVQMMDVPEMKKELKFSQPGWRSGDDSIKHIFMGDTNRYCRDLWSDSLRSLTDRKLWNRKFRQMVYPKVLELSKHDYQWLVKYGFNNKEFERLFREILMGLRS